MLVTVVGRVSDDVDQGEFREVVVLELVELAADDDDVARSDVVDFVDSNLEVVDLLAVSVCASV